jgi:hypothetical protein
VVFLLPTCSDISWLADADCSCDSCLAVQKLRSSEVDLVLAEGGGNDPLIRRTCE